MCRALDCGTRPSELIGVEDGYTAFCLDEAAAYIITQLKEGKRPILSRNKDGKPNEYKSFSELYRKYS